MAWTSDRNGRVIYISPKVDAILGYTTEEIRASGANLWLGRIHPEYFGRVNQAYRALFDDQGAFYQEYRIRRKDGAWIWVQDRAMGTHEEDGLLYADGFLCDITGRKQAEAELHSQTTFLEAQANSTIDGFLVVDRKGKLACPRIAHSNRRGISRRAREIVFFPARLRKASPLLVTGTCDLNHRRQQPPAFT